MPVSTASSSGTYPVVLTADMVNSTRFSQQQVSKWLTELIGHLHSDRFHWLLPPEIYRGDSFQGVLHAPEQALRAALLARAALKAKSRETDLRIALGIGPISRLTDRPGTSDGEAFRLSGQLSDKMHEQRARIAIALPAPSPALQNTLNLLESLVEGWSMAQSEVMAALLSGKAIGEITEILSISQSAVSQRASAAKWWALEPFLATFHELLTPYYHHD